MFFKFLLSLVLTILLGFYLTGPAEMKTAIMITLIIIVAIILTLFSLHKEKVFNLKGQFLKHSTIILIAFLIAHYQYYIDYLLGFASYDNLYFWVNHTIVIKAMLLSTIGLIAFLIGYLSFIKKSLKQPIKKKEKIAGTTYLIFLSIICLSIYFFTANPLYLIGFYGAEKLGATATYSITLFSSLIFAVIIQNCRNMVLTNKIPINFKAYIKMQGYYLTILIGVYLLSVMISGDRGPLITFPMCYISGYFFVTKKKLRTKYGLILFFAAAFFISILGIARGLNKNLDFVSKLESSLNSDNRFKENSILPATQNLAVSVRSLHTAVNYVPGQRNFLYGRFQVQQIFSAIPFFSFFTPLLFTDNSYKYGGSAQFITWINQGDNPTSGDGTTCIADFYLDFGVFGVIFGMFLFGYLIRLCEIAMFNSFPSIFWHIFSVVYIVNAVYLSRSPVLINLKTVVFIYIILLVNNYVLNKKFN